MNYRMLAWYVGLVLRLQSVFLLFPLAFSVSNGEYQAVKGFLAALLVSIAAFVALSFVEYDRRKIMHIKDAFVAVATCWIAISLTGALPYWVSGEIPFFLDALFESVSGFTTTGASILPDVEALSRGLLLWRSFTHWIGGMGVLVFLLALVPAISGGERTVSVMRAESSGPAPGKLVPKLRQSSKILYIIYFALTLLQILLLLAGGMPLFDSIVNAFSTAGTGGFAIKNASMAYYNSVYLEVVTTVFMILFGVNFNIFYFLLIRNFRAIFKSEELRAYLGIITAATVLIALNIFGTIYRTFGQSLRYAAFQVASIITSTGFATTDYDLWPTFSKAVLLFLMLTGACAGSTGGGLKMARIVILFREARRLLFRMVHPRSVEIVKLDGKTVEKTVVHAVNAYFSTFMMLLIFSCLVVSLDGFDFESTFSSVLATLNNIGPGFGVVGPEGNFGVFSPMSKLLFSVNMLMGRLEIYPVLLMLSPRTWRRI